MNFNREMNFNSAIQSAPTGATPVKEGGVIFKVWAPHASEVHVVGDFNDWDPTSHPLERDGDLWGTLVGAATVGSEYQFSLTTAQGVLKRNDPVARAMTNSVGNGIVVDHTSFDWDGDRDFRLAPWNEIVIYELHLGTYYRGDDKESVGTFDEAIERLDHLVALGINVIELMPIAEFAGDVSWGYNPAHPYAVESAYGGAEAFKRFVMAAHKRGIAIILDVVYNHFGPSDLDLWQFDGWCENDKGGIYFYNDWRSTTPWGDTRPDYGRAEVRDYIRENALMWLRDYHVDGLRLDMTFYMRSVDDGTELPEGWSLTQTINDAVQNEFPGALMIAEDLRSNEWLTKPTGGGGAGFGSQWDEQFVHPVRALLIAQEDDERSVESLIEAMGFRYNGDAFQRVVYTESHDEVANGKSRVPTEVDEFEQQGYWARKRSALGACLTMTAPGIPMILQGQEVLMTGHFEDSYELHWENAETHAPIVRLYRDLISLRRDLDGRGRALMSRDIEVLHTNSLEKVVVFLRGNDHEGRFVVVVNLTNRAWDDYRFPLPHGGKWRLVFKADAPAYGEDFGSAESGSVLAEEAAMDGRSHSASTGIGSYDCLVFAAD